MIQGIECDHSTSVLKRKAASIAAAARGCRHFQHITKPELHVVGRLH